MLRSAILALTILACAPVLAIDVVETSTPGSLIDSALPLTTDTIDIVDDLTMEDVEITFDIVHTFQADLEIDLIAPGGTTVRLTADSGGGNNDVFCTFGVLGNPFDAAFLAVAGAEMEAQGPGAMADYVGSSSLGIWTLNIVDDAGGDTGTLNSWTLRVSDDAATPATPFPPTNDTCASAITVGENSTTAYNTGAATFSGIDNGCSGAGDNLDVWFEVDLPTGCDGTVTFEISAGYLSSLAIWDGTAGCPIIGSSPIDCQDSLITFTLVPGVTPANVFVQAGGFDGESGLADLIVTTTLVGSTNDICADRETVVEGSSTPFDTTCAGADGINPGCGSTFTDPVDVWYELVVGAGISAVTIDTEGSAFDTRLAVWDGTIGCPAPGDTPIACDDDGGSGALSTLTLPVTPGDVLIIQVGGFGGAQGAGSVQVTEFIPIGNDFCADAIEAFDGITAIDTTTATADGIAPGCGGAAPVDIWFTHTVTNDGELRIDTFGSGFDTRLALWPAGACPISGDIPLACNDDTGGLQSQIIFLPVLAGDEFLIQVGGFGAATGVGTLNIESGLGPAPDIAGLTCVGQTDAIDVSWTNPVMYDSIVVTLDGTIVATLAGTDTTYTATGLTSFTTYTVGVEGIPDPALFGPGNEVTCTVTTPGDATDEVVIVAAEELSDIDSVTALNAALTAGGATPVTVSALSEIGGTPASIWYVGGTFPDNTPLTSADGTALVAFQAAGVGLYVSGSDVWGFDAATDFFLIDGVDEVATLDGDDSHLGMIGADLLAGFDAAYNQDQIGLDYTDQMAVSVADSLGPDARVILSDDGTGGAAAYDTGIAYYVSSGGPVLSISSEFGGYAGDQNALAAALFDFLGGTVTPGGQFRRGDANDDGGVDISDAIFILSELFVPGSTPGTCDDAFDTNDDGGKDISDAVFLLSALFVPGSAAPAAPGDSCGADPTMDGIDCAAYTNCP